MCDPKWADNAIKHDMERWNRYCDAAKSEKEWTSQRLQWFFSPQSILFGVYVLSCVKAEQPMALDGFRRMLCLLGVSSALVVMFSVIAAAVMHRSWTSRMNLVVKKYADTQYCHDFTFGTLPHWPARITRWIPVVMIILFISAWLYLLFYPPALIAPTLSSGAL